MAPVSNTVVGIDDDQRFALMKFRRSVKDILKPEYDDHFLLRWLKGKCLFFFNDSFTDFQLTVIFDMEGFSMRQYAWKPAAEMVVTLLKIYEANYPEILKTCLIVNAPKVFALAFSVIKKFMHENTISKIKIYGTDSKKWQAQVLAMVDKDQLPVFYGGTMVDENGDTKCSLIVSVLKFYKCTCILNSFSFNLC
ncbi:unnamed protein product [Diatraea saccharalis]|uniref:CRAL-TRIO domain-containing protein n=1 Tax=Diatraea saccharalis TaxID=40085 RepID=A0A9N9QVC8_9NEOP|nr:unnamed protein product [Diatraea saccharalis]